MIHINENWNAGNNKYQCPYCKKEYSKMGISTHIWRAHGDGQKHDPLIDLKNGTRIIWSKGQSFSKEHRDKMSDNHVGMLNKKHSEKTRKRMSASQIGKKHSNETREKISKNSRVSAIKRIEQNKFNGNQFYPNYNPDACKIIDNYGKKNGYNFQHAENGGEVCIEGYWPDGLDEKHKTIIEIDEKHHFNTDGNLKTKDVKRQKYLEKLGYKFIRVRI